MKSKKDLYRKALNGKTDKAWERHKEANKEAKRVVREAKERNWVRWGSSCRGTFWRISERFGKR